MAELVDDTYGCLTPDSFSLPALSNGPLSGRTFALKDMVDLYGHTPSFGLRRWQVTHRPANNEAPLVSQLRRAGAAMRGLVTLDQLAFSIIGDVSDGHPPTNPLYPKRWSGGSSSGTAVAVAGHMADIGIGSDTAGSIRVPAAACGVYSIRPTVGRINDQGMIILSPSMDTPGVMTRSAALLELACASLFQPVATAVSVRRVLVPQLAAHEAAAPVRQAIRQTADRLGRLGYDCVDVREPHFYDSAHAQLMAAIHCREIWDRHGNWLADNLPYLRLDVRQRVEQTAAIAEVSAQVWQTHMQARAELRAWYERQVTPGTAVLLPVTPRLLPLRRASHDQLLAFRAATLRFTALASLTAAPQVVVPVAVAGSVYGVGLLGAPDQDEALLGLARRMDETDVLVDG